MPPCFQIKKTPYRSSICTKKGAHFAGLGIYAYSVSQVFIHALQLRNWQNYLSRLYYLKQRIEVWRKDNLRSAISSAGFRSSCRVEGQKFCPTGSNKPCWIDIAFPL